MIESIHIHNFQCHKDLALDLGRSTVLQGDSNHGKTAVLRALYWVAYNEPKGDAYVSSWAVTKTKNGSRFKQGEYTEVVLAVDGHTIVRHRDNDFNGYLVDGVKYEALRGGVPDAVTQILNLSDVSVQKQLDAPFLLSMTPGEAATFLNSLAGLDDVSGILATAKKVSMDATAAADKAAADATTAEEQAQQYGWVDEAQEIANRCGENEKSLLSIRVRLEAIGATVEDYDLNAKEMHPLDQALAALPPFTDNSAVIKACQEGIAALRSYRDADQEDAAMSLAWTNIEKLGEYPEGEGTGREKLEKSLEDYDSLEDLGKLQEAEAEIGALDDSCLQVIQTYPRTQLEQTLKDYDSLEDIAVIDNEIKALEASIEGQACPACGRPYSMH